MESEPIQIELILATVDLNDIVEFEYQGDAMSESINGTTVKALPIPESQWSRVTGNVVVLKLKSGDTYIGKLSEVKPDFFRLKPENSKYPSETIAREEVANLLAVATLSKEEHDPIEFSKTIRGCLGIEKG